METIARGAPATPVGLLVPFRILAVVTAALILVQAFLAGQWWFLNQAGLISVHGWLGNVSFLTAILLALLALVEMRRSGWGRAELVLSVVLVLLMTAQLGLGYSGRRSAAAAALHIPNGVLLTMVIAALLALAWRPATASPGRG